MDIATYYKLSIKQQPTLKFSSYQQSLLTHPTLRPYLGQTQTVAYSHVLVNRYSQILLLGSPEAYALTSARLAWQKNRLQLEPARLHTGPKRSLDAAVGTYQTLQLPPVKKILDKLSKPEKQVLLVDLLREGQKTQTAEAFCCLYSCEPINVLMLIHHVPDTTTPLGRKADFLAPNLEGMDPETITTLVLSDPVAGGVNQFFALDYFIDKLPHLETVIIIAFHLSRYGGVALCRYLEQHKIKSYFLGFGALLDSIPPLMYFSPPPVDDPPRFVDSRHITLLKKLYGKAANKLCVAGNWTSMFLAPQVGLDWFSKELEENKLTLEKIRQTKIKTASLKKMGFSANDLIPASTFLEAANADQTKQLNTALERF